MKRKRVRKDKLSILKDLNIEEDREAVVVAMGWKNGLKVLGEMNNAHIIKEEVQGAVKEMKAVKAVGLDGRAVECLKSGSTSVIEWLVRLVNVCYVSSMVPVAWRSAYVVPLYKGKGDKYECASFLGINLLSVEGKVYGRALIIYLRYLVYWSSTEIMSS